MRLSSFRKPYNDRPVASLQNETPGEAFACPGDLTVRDRLQAVTEPGPRILYRAMTDSDQQPLNDDDRLAIIRVLSKPRFQTYLNASGHDADRAWRMYLWNARLGEAFHLPVQTAEVGLRNSIDVVLTELFGPNWGSSHRFESSLDDRAQQDLVTVKKRIKNKGQQIDNGQIVASLSFGFWVGLLHRKHYPAIWSKHLTTGFPHLPNNVTRQDVFLRAQEVNKLRNRISHHEPIIRVDISKEYGAILELLEWICPVTSILLKPHFRVSMVMRERPRPKP